MTDTHTTMYHLLLTFVKTFIKSRKCTYLHTQCNKHLTLPAVVTHCVSMVFNICYMQQQCLMLLTL